MRDRFSGPVIAIAGPTGVGKTAVGELLAERADAEIVSADSMQVYRGMDIGTSKPDADERRVAYHCIDLVEPGEAYSAARYQADSRSAIDSILARGKAPFVVGGTGLYLRAALDDLVFPAGEQLDESRERIEALATDLGSRGLHAYLKERDPASAGVIHPNNTRRVVRALQMLEVEGVSYAQQNVGFSKRRAVYEVLWIGLTMQREALYASIDARVDDMLARGLLDEVRRLLDRGYRKALTASQAIGYKELVPVLEEGADEADAVERIKQATRRYAKRQITWFRADPRIQWIDRTGMSPQEAAEAAAPLVQSFVGPLIARRHDAS